MDTGSKRSGLTHVRKVVMLLLVVFIAYLAAPLFVDIVPAPLVDNVRIVNHDIYQAIDRTRRIPAEVALPHVARAGMTQFVKLMPLGEAVRSRVQARLAGRDFVDELVPFLLMVKDMYVASGELEVQKFDEHFRAQYTATDNTPGIEHSMFSWRPQTDQEAEQQAEQQGEQQPEQQQAEQSSTGSEQAEGGFGLSLDLAAELVTLYDALYLVGNDQAESVLGRLACTADEISERLASTAQRVQPAVRSLLQQVRGSMPADAEMGTSLDAILTDDVRLETITLSLVHFMDLMVCKHYQMFASSISREQQLGQWLHNELDQPGGGELWSYLDYAQHQRRYGVMIAVDGLQGHLIEALASNDYDGPFMQAILQEQQAGMARVDEANQERLAQQTDFLEMFAREGYSDLAYLPFFTDLYDYAGATDPFHPQAVAQSGISTTPTISVRNLPIIKTGAPVAGAGATGVPNFHFVDRTFELDGEQQGRAYYFFGNDALQLTSLTQAAGMQSLFQRLPTRSSYSCTAQYDEYANAGIDPFLNLALGEAVRDFGEVLCFQELSQRADNELRLAELRAELMALRTRLGADAPWYNWYQLWNRDTALTRAQQLVDEIASLQARAMPELLLYYNPWPDHFAHFTGPFADEILSPSGELARLDYWLGQLTQLYQHAGLGDRVLYGMAGDHGLSPVFELVSPQARVLDYLAGQGVPMNIIKISSDEGEGPKLTHVLRPPSMRGYDVVIASTAGGNLMFDFFVNQTDQWDQQPIENELRAWQPIAWQDAGSERSIDLIDTMVERLGDSLAYLVVRTARGNDVERADIALYGPGGQGMITRRGQRIMYTFSGRDLLGLKRLSRYDEFGAEGSARHQAFYQRCVAEAEPGNPSSWCDESQWRALASYTDKPDSVVQLAHLYDSDRAGTVNLFPAEGIAYNSIVPGRHAGESFHEKDAFAGLWGVPVVPDTADRRLGSVLGGSIPMAIYEYLSGREITAQDEGWGYPSLSQAINLATDGAEEMTTERTE